MEGPIKITVSGWPACKFYQRARKVVEGLGALYPDRFVVEIVELPTRDDFIPFVQRRAEELGVAHRSSPLVWLNDSTYLGGCDDTVKFVKQRLGQAKRTLPTVSQAPVPAADGEFDFDLIIIGGGSGGLACSKEAAQLGARVAVLDFVRPSPHGSTWGLGGTCVNVGCIPKKLFHQAALLGTSMHDARSFGWAVPGKAAHDWDELVGNIQDYIRGLNFQYRVQLRDNSVTYLNALGSFVDANTIECVDVHNKRSTIRGKYIVVAVGGRPTPLTCPGGELAVSSDDIFSLDHAPGKTLVVGASYVALECAGFLTGLGYDATIMVRSILLRGFDQDMAERIGAYMAEEGTKFMRGFVPHSMERTASGRILVRWSESGSTEVAGQDEFDTVLAAVGRTPEIAGLHMSNAGVTIAPSGKIPVVHEQTNVPNVFAIGDVVEGKLELTPVAIQAGRLLARRLFGLSTTGMDYELVPTTVFTPLEYGCIGLTEEDAKARLGEEAVEVFHSTYAPLEWTLCEGRQQEACYAKVICNKLDDLRVVGFHILGPNAGEVTQGFGTALRLGATHQDLLDTVGIHPTVAEEMVQLSVSKSSGAAAQKGGC